MTEEQAKEYAKRFAVYQKGVRVVKPKDNRWGVQLCPGGRVLRTAEECENWL